MTDEEAVVQAAAEAAEEVVLSRLGHGDVEDLDITVSFEDAVLEVEVYVHAPEAENTDQVVDDAVLAAQNAADDLVE
jgi:hypothetical protein